MDDNHESERDLKKKTTMLARHGGAYMPVIPARRSQAQGLDCTRQRDSVSKNTKEEIKKRRRRISTQTLDFFFKYGYVSCVYVCGRRVALAQMPIETRGIRSIQSLSYRQL